MVSVEFIFLETPEDYTDLGGGCCNMVTVPEVGDILTFDQDDSRISKRQFNSESFQVIKRQFVLTRVPKPPSPIQGFAVNPQERTVWMECVPNTCRVYLIEIS